MSDKTKEDLEQIQKQGQIVMDLVMRVAAVERLLIDKKIITEQELGQTLEKLTTELMEQIRQRLESQVDDAKKE
jgi:hypothetical protein